MLTALDIGLPTDHIKPLIGQAFVGPDVTGETAVEAVTRRGKPAHVRLLCSAFRAVDGAVNGALLLMNSALSAGARRMAADRLPETGAVTCLRVVESLVRREQDVVDPGARTRRQRFGRYR